ncbi:replication initiation and membrane attachment family protein [Sutcliffiella rhizosphaerae]|uniref:Replication initiation and membrane attachment protein n=1 Tax=Sutcliffiella rhizosphaerae TaxID=2880967 RepID=A0ABM8YIN1_9BACI|nr:DnaD domain protein [Sutcliffiella rhizosphaerae]CAG9619590.1 Replication initiation and membrane attachment protein [Sutcliffiella rhizosphaerae]
MSDRHWNELVPVDRYIVRSNGVLQSFDRKILTKLYQPLLGYRGYSLFMTLWSELEEENLWGEETTHHSIMTTMQCNLKDIHQERLKLEGIGLLKTLVREENQIRTFIYELQPPLSPEAFFSEPMLTIYLYNRLGKTKYASIKKYFSESVLPQEEYREITRSFSDVFQSVQSENLVYASNEQMMEELPLEEGAEFVDRKVGKEPKISEQSFDFELFYAGLSEVVIPKKSITPKVIEAIEKLAYIYSVDPLSMRDMMMNTIDVDGKVNIEKLRKAARDWYQLEYQDTLPTLVEKVQPIHLKQFTNKKPATKDEQLIQQLENVSPKQMLTDLSNGSEPSISDLRIVEDVLFKQQLTPGVVNVLLYYVLLKADMKLNRKYVEKIASHWARKQVKTVGEAMELAKEEHRQYQNWAESKSTNSTVQTSSTSKSKNEKTVRNRFVSEEGLTGETNEEADRFQEVQEVEKQELMKRLEKLKGKRLKLD